MQDFKKTVNEQSEIIQALAEQIQIQQNYIKIKLKERDKALMVAIRENQEAKKQSLWRKKKTRSLRIENGISFGNRKITYKAGSE